jgi:hypothetical protein
MHFSRSMFGGASLFALCLLFAVETSCGDEKPRYKEVRLQCTTSLDVNTTTGVNLVDAYICSGTTVTWNAKGHKFAVFFKDKTKCPFTNGCRGINDQHPTSSTVINMTLLTVYDYGIVVDDDVFDPHVVGGGGS